MKGNAARAGSAMGSESVVRRLVALARLPLADAAVGFAASGVPVFPCVPGQKRPLTRHGLRDASADAAQVEAWWRRWPAANVGLPTGQVSGLDVLDVDVRESGSGMPAFADLCVRGVADRWVVLVGTPSGGVHAYYPAVPGRLQRCWQAAAAHIDFRGDGGYVLAPPSVVTGVDGTARGYAVAAVTDGPSAALDAAGVHDLLAPRRAHDMSTAASVGKTDADTARLAAWVAGRGEGERNAGLFWAACRLAEHGASQHEIAAVLTAAAKKAGLGRVEIAATIRSAIRTVRHDVAPVGELISDRPPPTRSGLPPSHASAALSSARESRPASLSRNEQN